MTDSTFHKNSFWYAAGTIALILVLGASTFARNSLWQDGIALWENTLSQSPRKARAHMNFGLFLESLGLAARAKEEFQLAWRYSPGFFQGVGAFLKKDNGHKTVRTAEEEYRLGVASAAKGLPDEAIDHYEAALTLRPDMAEIYNNLGNAYDAKGMTGKAVEQYQTALRLRPDYAEAHYNLGMVYEARGLVNEARKEYQEALKVKHDFAEARARLDALRYRTSK